MMIMSSRDRDAVISPHQERDEDLKLTIVDDVNCWLNLERERVTRLAMFSALLFLYSTRT